MAVRTSEPLKQKVYTKQGEEWVLSANEVEIDAGWYLVYPPPPAEEK